MKYLVVLNHNISAVYSDMIVMVTIYANIKSLLIIYMEYDSLVSALGRRK